MHLKITFSDLHEKCSQTSEFSEAQGLPTC